MSGTTGQTESLSAELLKAANLLRSKGMDHAAAQLLAPEEVAKPAEAPAPVLALVEQPKQKRKYTKRAKVEASAPEEKSPEKKRKYTKRAKAVEKTIKAKSVKAKSVKTKSKVTKAKHKPVSGQSGPAIKELTFEDLNKKEKLLLGCFEVKGDREVRTIDELAAEAFKTASVSVKKANSWARNSLRRPVRAGLVEKPEPGSYRLTALGRKIVNK